MINFKKKYNRSLNNFSKTLRPAFTLIEILVAVSILSMAFLYVLKVHTDNRKHIIYLSERNKNSLQDSLYLTKNILRHHKDTKTAYEILQRHIKVKEDQSRETLKKTQRAIFIPKEIKIIPPPDRPGPTALVNEVKLKDAHSSNYWHFKIQSF
jgi:prepilin-type N-terminal cleavage/methylation domain-containing protein